MAIYRRWVAQRRAQRDRAQAHAIQLVMKCFISVHYHCGVQSTKVSVAAFTALATLDPTTAPSERQTSLHAEAAADGHAGAPGTLQPPTRQKHDACKSQQYDENFKNFMLDGNAGTAQASQMNVAVAEPFPLDDRVGCGATWCNAEEPSQ
eukprot:TRINITY_DN78222_c0_g1_i1.p1 TRINITY_DN78222_c0_g1~~TRINITY_DN78222_c0_g1_i1.p1  ORF type:complete len:170 (+),score=27.65 TRINITY_DN78222_c0_g1_i1:62-511(+)